MVWNTLTVVQKHGIVQRYSVREEIGRSAICDGSCARGRGREIGGPHYKFNLTNGSENLETMEYMKCGCIYHMARRGVSPAAILSGPIHILLERESCKEKDKESRIRKLWRQIAKHVPGEAKKTCNSRTVPVIFNQKAVKFEFHISTELVYFFLSFYHRRQYLLPW